MAMVYKIDVMQTLKEKGYSSTKLRKEKLLAEGVMQALRRGEPISWANISKLCLLLDCQPGDILEYVPDEPAADSK